MLVTSIFFSHIVFNNFNDTLNLSPTIGLTVDFSRTLARKIRCICETLLPLKNPFFFFFLRNMTLIFELDLCK